MTPLGRAAAALALASAIAAPIGAGAELSVVELHGSPRERGLAHGRALKERIHAHVARWKAELAKATKTEPDALLAAFLRDTRFAAAAKRWTPDLLEEVAGIAEGSGLPFDTVFALQLIDELWVYVEERDAHHCSAVGAAAHGASPAFVAQNMDLETFRDGAQAVLHIRGDASTPEQYILTAAGVVALDGMNARGVGVVVNTLSQLRSSRDGLPVAFVIRGVLGKTSADEALRFLKTVKHASGQNYLLGADARVFDLEASAGKVAAAMPGAEVVFHTNHPLANDDVKAAPTPAPGAPDSGEEGNSAARYRELETRLGRNSAKAGKVRTASLADAKAALASKDSEKNPICRAARADGGDYGLFTFASVVMTLSGTPAFEVSAGPPDHNPYRRFELAAPAARAVGR